MYGPDGGLPALGRRRRRYRVSRMDGPCGQRGVPGDGALFGGTGGLFVMKTQGSGKMLISGYGDIVEIALDGTEDFVVDNQHVLAWTESLSYSIEVASGTFGFKTGEGLVNKFRGKGKILIQSRNVEALAQSIIPFIPSKG